MRRVRPTCPAPRIFRSASAISKPSWQPSSTRRRASACALPPPPPLGGGTAAPRPEAAAPASSCRCCCCGGGASSRHREARSLRPTRPRSWCSCARPKRSACSTTMMEASGTSTPTCTHNSRRGTARGIRGFAGRLVPHTDLPPHLEKGRV
eukprot:351201-Chlamydomonas_euryale.AAC.10